MNEEGYANVPESTLNKWQFSIELGFETSTGLTGTITAESLEEMNMLRMNIGIEHGNFEYRKKYLKRNVSDEIQIRAFEMLADKKYTSCANSIIGMPDETRDLIFDKFLPR